MQPCKGIIRCCVLMCCVIVRSAVPCSAAVVVDFEDFLDPNGDPLAAESHYIGPDPNGVDVPGDFGTTVREGGFASRGVTFVNRYNLDFNSWSSFAVSNETNTTTPGFGNQFSSYTGGGAGPGADNFGVAFGYDDLAPTLIDAIPFNPLNVAHLQALPSLVLPAAFQAVSVLVTNTTYGALALLQGDGPSKQFGGLSGADPDWFKLSVFGIDDDGQPLGTEVEFYLADYRFVDDSLDYILDDWSFVDLSLLSAARSLHFNLSSSDVGDFGMNTPGTFALDDLTIQAVPEPGALSLLAACGLVGGTMARRRLRQNVERGANPQASSTLFP